MGLLYTIGHSQHEFEYFANLLKKFEINYLLDVRSTPYSKYAETFNKEQLENGKDLRAYPSTLCGTDELDGTYKIRTTVERSINHFKDSFGLAGRRTKNEKTFHADLLLAGITQLIGVLLADRIKQHQYIRSLKPLIA